MDIRGEQRRREERTGEQRIEGEDVGGELT